MDMTYTDAETADAAGVVSSNATSSVISAQTTNITFRAVSSPNQNQIDDGETYWQVQSRENRYLNDGNPAYQHGYLQGRGNPALTRREYDEETDNGTAHRVEETYYEPDCGQLPAMGSYYEFTTAQAGTLQLAIYLNNNAPLYVVDEAGTVPMAPEAFTAEGYFNNNTWTGYGDGTTSFYTGLTMDVDYTLQPEGVNQPYLGYVSFPVEADKTYMVFSPRFQLGLYGWAFAAGTGAGIDGVEVESQDDPNAPDYNLAGQRVSKDAKGILIQNGKKFIRK